MTGDAANNVFDGGDGNDHLSGGPGDDLLEDRHGTDTLYGGNSGDTGGDTASYKCLGEVKPGGGCHGVVADLAAGTASSVAGATGVFPHALSTIENITGSMGDDTLTGNAFGNILSNGGNGIATMTGGGGADISDVTMLDSGATTLLPKGWK